jgi:hypothetical protein
MTPIIAWTETEPVTVVQPRLWKFEVGKYPHAVYGQVWPDPGGANYFKWRVWWFDVDGVSMHAESTARPLIAAKDAAERFAKNITVKQDATHE